MGRLLTRNLEDSNKSNADDVAMTVAYIWVLCNVYTVSPRPYVVKQVDELYSEYCYLNKYPKSKRSGAKYVERLKTFKNSLPELFDIKCNNSDRIKSQTMHWCVRMEKDDIQFYNNQKLIPPIGHCTTTVDKHSKAKSLRLKEKKARK